MPGVRAAANDSQQKQPRQKQVLDRKILSEEAQHWYDEVVVAESRLEKKDLEIAELQKSKRDLILKIDGLETDLARASSQLVEEDMEKKKTKKENDSTKLQVEQKITDNMTLKEQIASLYSSLEDEQKKTSELQKELDEANALKAALHAELDDIETNAQSMVEKKESDAEAKLKEIYDMLEEEFIHVGRGLNLDDYIKLYKEQQETRLRRDRSSTSLDSHALSDLNCVRRSRSRKRQISLGDELLQVSSNGYDTDNDSLFNEKGDDTVTRSLSLEPHSDYKTFSNARLPSCTTEELDSTHDVRSMITQNLYTSEPVEDGVMKKVDSQAWEPDPDGPLLGSSKKTEGSSKHARAFSKETEKDKHYEEEDMRLQSYLRNANHTAAQRQHEKEKKGYDTQKLFIENIQAKEDLRTAKAEIDTLKKREQKLQSKPSSAELRFSSIDSIDIRPVAVATDAAETQSKSSSVELSFSNISSIVISPAEARAEKAERSLQELEAPVLRGLRGSSPIWLRLVVSGLLLLYAYLLADVISERHLFNEVNNLTVRHMTYGSTLGQRKGWVWLMNLENYLQMDSSRPF